MMLTSIFDNYSYWGKKFESYSFYDYKKIISYMKYSIRQKKDFLFNKYNPNFLSKVQQLFTILKCNMLIALVESLSINKSAENAIKKKNPGINAKQNNVVLILLALFIL